MWVPTLTLQRKHKFRAGLSQVLSQSSIMAAHHKLATADSDATAFDSAKHTRDNTSPTESNFPELLYNGNGHSEHNKLSPTRKSRPRSYPPIIPPDHPNRTLVLCFDGTGNEFDADNSNIVQFVSLLKKGDSTQQLVYYQAGIGTYTSNKDATPIMPSARKTLDEMIGLSIGDHIMSGYEFLMQNYCDGDKICLFGFSRGAYTARSLAGMLYKVGLLPAGNFQQVPFAYKIYTRADKVGWEQSHEFKKAFSMDISIEFIGVWDTVSSLGVIPKSLPVNTSSTTLRTFRHALSLDERRVKFQAIHWKEKAIHLKNHCRTATANSVDTDAKEVWFAGCHGDVGGGAVSNKTRHSLARIPLRWMIRECFKTNTGIMFDADSLFKVGLDPSSLHPFVATRPPPPPVGSNCIRKPPATPIPINIPALISQKEKHPNLLEESEKPFLETEEEEELHDAMSPDCDQLKIPSAWPWWILEVLPLVPVFYKSKRQGKSRRLLRYLKPHLGAPRCIPHLQHSSGLKVHRSVHLRMQAAYEDEKKDKKYVPAIHFGVEPTWVD